LDKFGLIFLNTDCFEHVRTMHSICQEEHMVPIVDTVLLYSKFATRNSPACQY